MRKLLCPVVFGLLVVGGADAVDPNCKGTYAQKDKCDGGIVPKTYWESEVCEGDKLSPLVCLHAIAFNQDNFTCSAPQLDNTRNPPSYTSYCIDSVNSINCTKRRPCTGVLMLREDGVPFIRCTPTGEMIPSYALQKVNLSSSTPGFMCTETVPLP